MMSNTINIDLIAAGLDRYFSIQHATPNFIRLVPTLILADARFAVWESFADALNDTSTGYTAHFVVLDWRNPPQGLVIVPTRDTFDTQQLADILKVIADAVKDVMAA